MTDRFSVIQNNTGCIFIMDASKKEGEPGRTVAHFFQDEHNPNKAQMLATLCAKHLNDEAARRAAKQGEE